MFDFFSDFLTDVSDPDTFWGDSYGMDETYGDIGYGEDWTDYGSASDWGTDADVSTWGEGSTSFGSIGKAALAGVSGGIGALGKATQNRPASLAIQMGSRGTGGDKMPIRAMGDAKGVSPLQSKSPDALNLYWMEKMRDFARWKATVSATDPDKSISRR